MNAPFLRQRSQVRLVPLDHATERNRLTEFVHRHPEGTPFHLPIWLDAIADGTGARSFALISEAGEQITGYLPLHEVHSPVFGRLLASTGFAVGGGALVGDDGDGSALFQGAEELALRNSCPTIELRGGLTPDVREGWLRQNKSHCGFVIELAADDEAQLLAVPRKQRAEVRKGLTNDLEIRTGSDLADREMHYAVYSESVRNLGTPVFPRALFDAVLDRFGEAADILTVLSEGRPVASVLSLYHGGAVMPYWGGGTFDARRLRANDRMYFELMRHARNRGCSHFDFGRSKTDSGAYHFKRNWGFEPEPLHYAVWTAPGAERRDANPTSAKNALQVSLWQKLPLGVANRIGPWIARGLG